MCACACLSEAPRGSGPGPLGPFLLPLTRGFGQIWRGHKITTYPFSPRKNGRKGMAQSQGWVRRYFKAFCKGFFVAVPVAVTFLDRVACVARVEGASMQPSLNPGGSQSSDVVLLNHWKVRNFEVQRGDIVSLVCLYLLTQTSIKITLPSPQNIPSCPFPVSFYHHTSWETIFLIFLLFLASWVAQQ
ncbi:mitochondrial inner membrane protease subunit 2 isoform X9 [Bubalus kerabau]|uniref:mitochondrial inner membrane protease subunit 2 isoform X9 n=1 Tax=Bubalus carabanensis TaxID=3119969 RepID=UPI00244EA5E9|nr:mitochondrial inner membrane protease subunit 2 isoform X9 [Bubalus carabanensis]